VQLAALCAMLNTLSPIVTDAVRGEVVKFGETIIVTLSLPVPLAGVTVATAADELTAIQAQFVVTFTSMRPPVWLIVADVESSVYEQAKAVWLSVKV
jgi:hypothetical protein